MPIRRSAALLSLVLVGAPAASFASIRALKRAFLWGDSSEGVASAESKRPKSWTAGKGRALKEIVQKAPKEKFTFDPNAQIVFQDRLHRDIIRDALEDGDTVFWQPAWSDLPPLIKTMRHLDEKPDSAFDLFKKASLNTPFLAADHPDFAYLENVRFYLLMKQLVTQKNKKGSLVGLNNASFSFSPLVMR